MLPVNYCLNVKYLLLDLFVFDMMHMCIVNESAIKNEMRIVFVVCRVISFGIYKIAEYKFSKESMMPENLT